MQCPLCLDAPLEPKYVAGTEVDICIRCRGIWLDRGELDRLLGDGPRGGRPTERGRDERGGDRGRRDEPSGDRERDDDRPRRSSSKRPKSKAKRLAELFEDVLDL